MKLLGIVLIISVSILYGYELVDRKKEKITELKKIYIMLINIESMLSYSYAAPEEILNCKDIGEASHLQQDIIEKMSMGENFQKVFKKSLSESFLIDSKDKVLLCTLSDFFGVMDRESQLKRLNKLIEETEKSINKKEVSLAEKQRLYMLCSVSFGLGIVILLI